MIKWVPSKARPVSCAVDPNTTELCRISFTGFLPQTLKSQIRTKEIRTLMALRFTITLW
jgi:hypothetical protein